MILINPNQILRLFYLFFICFIAVSSAFSATVLSSRLTGGGFIILKTQPGSQIQFQDKTVQADREGYAAIGFGRDIAGKQELLLITDSGEQRLHLEITSRQYNVQYIDGISGALVNPPESEMDRIIKESALVKQARQHYSELPYWRDEKFQWPVQAAITGVYGSQRFYNGEPRSPHWGIDLAAPKGTPVKAPASGKVVLAEADLYFSGGTLILDHGGGLTSSFLHLSKLNVKVGDLIKQGDVIAEVGSTGRSTGAHLDWRMNLNGERVDAALWVPKLGLP